MTFSSASNKLALLLADFSQTPAGKGHCEFGKSCCQYPDDDTRVPVVSQRVHFLTEELTGVPARFMRTRLRLAPAGLSLEVYDVKGVRVAGPLAFELLPEELQQAIDIEVQQLGVARKRA